MEAKNLENLQDLREDLLKYVHTLNLDNEEQTLVQETFMNAIVGRQKHKMDGYLRIWSNILLRKAFINNYNHIVMKDEAFDSDVNVFLKDTESDEDQELVFNKIVGNIERLNPKLREAFRMYAEGFNYKGIADTVRLSIETVKKRIFIARSQLMLQNI